MPISIISSELFKRTCEKLGLVVIDRTIDAATMLSKGLASTEGKPIDWIVYAATPNRAQADSRRSAYHLHVFISLGDEHGHDINTDILTTVLPKTGNTRSGEQPLTGTPDQWAAQVRTMDSATTDAVDRFAKAVMQDRKNSTDAL